MDENPWKKIFFPTCEILGVFAGIWAFIKIAKYLSGILKSEAMAFHKNLALVWEEFFSFAVWTIISLFVVGFIFVLRRLRDGWTFPDIGFKIKISAPKDIAYGLTVFCLSFILTFPFNIRYLPFRAELMKGSSLEKIAQQNPPSHIVVLTAIFMVLATCGAAFWEEVYWRGYAQNLVEKKVGPGAGFLSAMLFFSLLHYITRPYDLNTTIIVVINGIFFGLVFYASGSVWIASLVHILDNLWGDFPTYLYLKGHEHQAYSFAILLFVIAALGCVIGRRSLSHFFKKAWELFISSSIIIASAGVCIGIIALAYSWLQNRIQSNFGLWALTVVLLMISALLIGVSFLEKKGRNL